MTNLNVFIDGTWLYNQCAPRGALSNATDTPDLRFRLDFSKLNRALQEHIRNQGEECGGVGRAFFVTSVFSLAPEIDGWPDESDEITPEDVQRIKRNVASREIFTRAALTAGFREEAVLRPLLRPYVIRLLREHRYHLKQVDTTLVALVVREAMERPREYHVILTGDADILPAVKIAYPAYTTNVIVATLHPDELQPAHRQSAYALIDFEFRLSPFFLQDRAHQIIEGNFAHRCGECGKVFTTAAALPRNARPYCRGHRPARP